MQPVTPVQANIERPRKLTAELIEKVGKSILQKSKTLCAQAKSVSHHVP